MDLNKIPIGTLELDVMAAHGCGNPACDHNHDGVIYLAGACHPGAGVEVYYKQGSGVLVTGCRACKRVVVTVKVAQ